MKNDRRVEPTEAMIKAGALVLATSGLVRHSAYGSSDRFVEDLARDVFLGMTALLSPEKIDAIEFLIHADAVARATRQRRDSDGTFSPVAPELEETAGLVNVQGYDPPDAP